MGGCKEGEVQILIFSNVGMIYNLKCGPFSFSSFIQEDKFMCFSRFYGHSAQRPFGNGQIEMFWCGVAAKGLIKAVETHFRGYFLTINANVKHLSVQS